VFSSIFHGTAGIATQRPYQTDYLIYLIVKIAHATFVEHGNCAQYSAHQLANLTQHCIT
jgi:hypothetical protein